MLPDRDMKRSLTIPLFVVPHSHFDLIWRRPPAWYRKRRATIYMAALNALDARPDFRYSFCQSMGLKLFFADHPAENKRFLHLVREGRLEVIGGPMTIPDLNLSHGEAIVRNQMMGLEWLTKELGIRPEIACMEDAFGVPSSLPSLLMSCGLPFLRASRMPRPGRKDLSGPMRWQGHDGAVMMTCGPEGMAWGLGQPSNIDAPQHDYAGMVVQYRRDLQACAWDGSRPVLFSLLGEEHIPTEENIAAFVEAIDSLRIPYRWATAREFVQALRATDTLAKAPLVKEDLSRLFTGCYSSRIHQKAPIAGVEAALLAAENVLAAMGRPVASLAESWSDLFLLQFHDAYGGCHTPENVPFMQRHWTRAQAKTRRVLSGPALGNPLLFDCAIPFALPANLSGRKGEPLVAQSFDGALLAHRGLDALSSRVFSINVTGAKVKRHERLKELKTRHAAIQFTNTGPELVTSSGRMPAPGLLRLREDVGTLWTEDYTGREWRESPGMARLERVEEGPVFSRAVWSANLNFGPGLWPGFTSLAWRRSILLFKDSPAIWLRQELEWWGNSTEISWSLLPSGRAPLTSHGSMPFGSLIRPAYAPGADGLTGDVFPSPHWAAVGNRNSAWVVLHRGHPAFRAVKGGLENVLLRSPVKRWMPFFPVGPDATSWENGRHVADFLLVPQERFDAADAMRLGLAFQTGAAAMPALEVSPVHTLLRSLPDGLVATSLHQERGAWRVRLCEARGRAVVVNAPSGWCVARKTFSGEVVSPTAASVNVPARWMGDVWFESREEKS
jgi:hypothetical protein